jgi:copper(I)-binding protein
MRKISPACVFFFIIALPVFAAEPELAVRNGWTYPLTAQTTKTTVWFSVVNPTASKDVITEIATPLADVVKIFALSQRGDGVKRRQQIKVIEILPFSVLQVASAGYEVMLYDPKKKMQAGDTFPLFFTFEKAGEQKIMVEIKEK